MLCVKNERVMQCMMSYDLCPFGAIQYGKSRYYFVPETKTESIKLAVGSHYSKGKQIYAYDYVTKTWFVEFDCKQIVTDCGWCNESKSIQLFPVDKNGISVIKTAIKA